MIRICYIMLAMYVCVCNQLKEETIRSLAEEGLGFDEIQALTGCSSTCGSCREYAEDFILSVHARTSPAMQLKVVAGNVA
ncbi:MAG TPA: (2Fe-2S)-binding protein [Wenzhouxiangella sp.]|nr:(2Fe-2S)-binding protein [Wenzhouxiangella sp.]